MWKFIFAIPLFFHGMAHLSGFLSSWTSVDDGYSDKSWIFSQTVHLQHGIGWAFGLLWLVAMVGLVGAAFGIVFCQDWWPDLALTSTAVSIVVIVPWWQTVPPGAKVGALFDLLVLALLLSPLQDKFLEFIQ